MEVVLVLSHPGCPPCALPPSRAPGEHPLRKVTAQGQPGWESELRLLTGKDAAPDGQTDGQTHARGRQTRGSSSPGRSHTGTRWSLAV